MYCVTLIAGQAQYTSPTQKQTQSQKQMQSHRPDHSIPVCDIKGRIHCCIRIPPRRASPLECLRQDSHVASLQKSSMQALSRCI